MSDKIVPKRDVGKVIEVEKLHQCPFLEQGGDDCQAREGYDPCEGERGSSPPPENCPLRAGDVVVRIKED